MGLCCLQEDFGCHPEKRCRSSVRTILGDGFEHQPGEGPRIRRNHLFLHGDLRRLVLVEDMIDSIKFGIFLWVMTYIGAWFNGLTLLILGLVSMFSLPKTYEVYQEQIDAYLALAQDQVKGIMAQLIEQRPRNLDELKELALRLFNIVVKQMPKDLDEVKEMAQRVVELLKKQMPKDLDEAKEMALKLYNSVVELIHAKIPIGKKDQ